MPLNKRAGMKLIEDGTALQKQGHEENSCSLRFDGLKQAEYGQNAVDAIASKGLSRSIKRSKARKNFMAECVYRKYGLDPDLLERHELRGSENSMEAQQLVDELISTLWRKGACAPTVVKLLDVNAMLGKLYGMDIRAPDTKELRWLSKNFQNRCIRQYPVTAKAKK